MTHLPNPRRGLSLQLNVICKVRSKPLGPEVEVEAKVKEGKINSIECVADIMTKCLLTADDRNRVLTVVV